MRDLLFAGIFAKMRRGRPNLAANQAALVVLLLPSGKSTREIAQLAGTTPQTVRNIRRGGVRISSTGLAVELGPGQFMAPRPMRCPGCRAMCEQFPCLSCGSCPSVGALVAVAKANGLIIEPGSRRRTPATAYHSEPASQSRLF